MGAIAFQKGLGVTHSCAHALGTVADMHHGLANGVMIDYALKHNAGAVPERFKTMAAMIALKDQSPEGFLKWLSDLKRETGIPAHLADAKPAVGKDKLGKLLEVAVSDSCHLNNPIACTRADFERIFTEAF
jgi:alcohol dehydrogenase class IV